MYKRYAYPLGLLQVQLDSRSLTDFVIALILALNRETWETMRLHGLTEETYEEWEVRVNGG